MNNSWKRFDLRGGGLQSINLHLARHLKKRRTAYLLLALFPLGLHRLYLASPGGALVFPAATLIAALLALAGWWPAALAVGAGMAALALLDARQIDGRVAELNKRRRLQAYLGHGASPPAGYRGRSFPDELAEYLDETKGEGAGRTDEASPSAAASGKRNLSLSDQERLLREIARRKRERH